MSWHDGVTDEGIAYGYRLAAASRLPLRSCW